MTINEIMEIFSNPETIGTLSVGDKMMAVGFTMILGMGITFVSLIILKFVIEGMAKVLVEKKVVAPKNVVAPVATTAIEEEDAVDDKALVAVITATLAMQLKTSVNNIRIKNIKKVGAANSTWNQVGLIEQISNRL